MNLKSIIYDIREQFRLLSDDEIITNEYIAWLVSRARATVMQQRYADPRNIIPAIEYQSITVPIGINGVSTTSIPSLIKTTGNPHASLKVYGVGIADTYLNVPLNVVSLERLPFVGSNPLLNDQIYCAVDHNGYIAFNSRNNLYKLIDSVVARGIYEDPEEVYILNNPSGDFYTSRYPISDSTLLDVRKIVDQKIANILGINKDELNDATEERLDQNPQGNK